MALKYLVNDKIELIAGDEAVIRFIGKTKLDNTIWYGIQYLSTKSVSKPTLITIHDIKSSNNNNNNNSISIKKKQINSNKAKKSHLKSPQKLKSVKKTSCSVVANGTNNKSKTSPNKKRSNVSPKKKYNDKSLKEKVNRSIAKKCNKNKEKKERSSSAPSSKIKPHLLSISDMNNTLALNDDFDDILSTIDSPKTCKNKKKKDKKSKHKNNNNKKNDKNDKNNKNKTHKRQTQHMSDLTKGILSSPSLSAKTSKKIPTLSINSEPILSINCNDNISSIGINFENQETQNMPSEITKIGRSKSDESMSSIKNRKTAPKWDYEYELAPIELATNLDFAVLIDDKHKDNNNKTNILTEEKEIEDDTDYKEQYAKIFSSIKTKTKSIKELRRKSAPNVDCDAKEACIHNKKSKKKNARKRGQSSDVIISPPVTPRKKKENGEKTSNIKNLTGSLKKLKLNRTQSNDRKNKKKCDRNSITHGMFSYIKDVSFNGKIVIGNRYLLKDDRYGICRYYGSIEQKKKGKYIGIELEVGEGDNNGSIKEKIYFKCIIKRKDIDNDKRALFITKNELKKDLGKA